MHIQEPTKALTSSLFPDRAMAGRQLGGAVRALELESPIVVGLPPGGVAVASEVARTLGAPLDVWLYALAFAPDGDDAPVVGALSEGGTWVAEETPGPTRTVQAWIQRSQDALASAGCRLRDGRPRAHVRRRDVVLVHDEVTATIPVRAVLRDLRALGARRVVLATPVATTQALRALARDADNTVCLCPLERLEHAGVRYAADELLDENALVRLLRTARRRAA